MQGGRLARSALDLAARPLLPQDDAAIAVMADNVEKVLPDIDTEDCALGACCLGHGVLLSPQPQTQRRSLAGQEHGRTIPREVKRFCRLVATPCARIRVVP
jgi:hypothetical protein